VGNDIPVDLEPVCRTQMIDPDTLVEIESPTLRLIMMKLQLSSSS
jgi:hypothetical protein